MLTFKEKAKRWGEDVSRAGQSHQQIARTERLDRLGGAAEGTRSRGGLVVLGHLCLRAAQRRLALRQLLGAAQAVLGSRKKSGFNFL